MMKIKIYWIGCILLAFLASGCSKDLGNYDYHDINSLTIKLDSSYVGIYGQRFTINPAVQMSMDQAENIKDTSKYGFEWYVIDPAAIPVTSGKIMLSKQLNLDTVLTLKPGANYTLYYKITDKKTNVKWMSTALFTVSTSIFEGWLALCEVNGQSRLDMAAYSTGNYKLIPGVLDSVGSGLSMTGKPLNIVYTAQAALLGSTLSNGIYLTTSEGTNRIDPETFKWTQNMNVQFDMLAPLPTNFAADLIVPCTPQANYLHSPDSNVYWHYRPLQKNWGAVINVVTGEPQPFKAAPFIAIPSTTTSFGSILFDPAKKRFLRHLSTAASCALMPGTGATLFDYNNMGMDLVYMAYSTYNTEVYSVFKNSTTNKFYLAKFTLGASINQTYYAEITGTDIANAELFAVNPDYGYLFYNAGGKVYEYDLGLKKSFLMMDKGNSKITLLKFHPFLKSAYATTTGKKLIVATYDPALPSGSAGTLDLYTVPGINGPLTSFLTITGFGKIKSLTYRER